MIVLKALRRFFIAATLLFVCASGASAQEFFDRCKSDLETYCASVTPGGGRVAACLYAHQDRISEPCFEATARIGVILESVFDRLTGTYEACAADIQAHCADVAAGGGRIVACLAKNADKVKPACLESARAMGAAFTPQ